MSAYAIEKRGSQFVVRAGHQDIMIFATKRQALLMIREACTQTVSPLRVALDPQATSASVS